MVKKNGFGLGLHAARHLVPSIEVWGRRNPSKAPLDGRDMGSVKEKWAAEKGKGLQSGAIN